MQTINGIEVFEAKSRGAWRKWLEKYHAKKQSVWLIMFNKKSNKIKVDYEALVEEALCYGWIDSKKVKRDDESSIQYFGPRKPKGNWSASNRKRARRLIKEGKMMPAGQAMIDLAKKTGTWNALNGVENVVIPADLQKQFERNKKAFTNFSAFPPSSKKMILTWILNAKKDETRKKRIEQTVTLASKNVRAQ
jgi:uncharacterized protein YdeI (YjbR/CyaY-like superfamily)